MSASLPTLRPAQHRLLAALPLDGASMDLRQAREAAGFAAEAQVLAAADGPVAEGWITIDEQTQETPILSDEGRRFATDGLPERRAIHAILKAGGCLSLSALADHIGEDARVAVGWLKRKGWARMEKADGPPMLVADAEPPQDADERALAALAGGGGAVEDVGSLAKRGGLVEVQRRTWRTLRLTESGRRVAQHARAMSVGEDVSQVTPELVARWADATPAEKARWDLRPFAFGAEVQARLSAKPHPLSQLMAQTRRVFWQMGFQEIRGDYVESCYWNMDALFIPQDHPARELQDTFYLRAPERLEVPEALLSRTAEVHRSGGKTGSKGWGGSFDPEVSRRALLRTHTTNTSVRHLAQHVHDEGSGGVHRVFGLGRVFRNETMDATHLPEFHQIEGIVTQPGATFDMLVGLCRHFFTALGFPQVRFRPAYFPYTEPSMEIEVHYNDKWMELGGCGVFRPEVTRPLGVKHPVLAWGFGLERLAMMRLGLKDIRQLYVSDIQWLKEQPLL